MYEGWLYRSGSAGGGVSSVDPCARESWSTVQDKLEDCNFFSFKGRMVCTTANLINGGHSARLPKTNQKVKRRTHKTV